MPVSRFLYVCGLVILLATAARAQTTLSVSIDPRVREEPATGRVVVYLIREEDASGNMRLSRAAPSSGPFFSSPQPMYGFEVRDLKPGVDVRLTDLATAFPVKWSELPPGEYRAQAVLDRHRQDSSWSREPGNLVSDIVTFTVGEAGNHRLILNRVVEVSERDPDATRAMGVEIVELRSKLLSEFRGEEVFLRATVVYPVDHDPERVYPAIYTVPGFGGNHLGGLGEPRRRQRTTDPETKRLHRAAFVITLDPEGPNGHHLFLDSDNNGPVGEALVRELVPHLTERFHLADQPEGRVLRGHSSGGWAVLHLALTYPQVFGAAFSSAPDPVDFRAFQAVNIYDSTNMYFRIGPSGEREPYPSYTSRGVVGMTVREENAMEEVIGPDNTSGQQWDSWFAAFGPRNGAGNPSALFDPETGAIDATIAKAYRAHDLSAKLEDDPDRYAPLWRTRIRLICGTEDNYDLDEAVSMLKKRLDTIRPATPSDPGYIKLVEGADHGTVMRSAEGRAFSGEMLEVLRVGGFLSE
ncbi:MAG: alpha/beta hydrolase-fold protein [Phycisphaerales bacterium JB050]